MTTKHTPGPWEIQQLETNRNGYDWPTFAVRSPQNVCLAVVGDVDRHHAEQHPANARLIAAAPDLLAALIELRDSYPWSANRTVGGELWSQVNAAIAKAEGGAA